MCVYCVYRNEDIAEKLKVLKEDFKCNMSQRITDRVIDADKQRGKEGKKQ